MLNKINIVMLGSHYLYFNAEEFCNQFGISFFSDYNTLFPATQTSTSLLPLSSPSRWEKASLL